MVGFIPYNAEMFTKSERAALIAGETIYPDGESYGHIICDDIRQMVQSKYGSSIYDRAVTYYFENTIWEFIPLSFNNIQDRLYEASISVSYTAMVLLEDSAIHIANSSILELLGNEADEEQTSTVDEIRNFMDKIEKIELDYSRAMSFWCDIPAFTTSKKSLEATRNGLKIQEHLSIMMRNKEQLGKIFDTKSNIIDRIYSGKTDRSLLLISILSIFSALIDSYDYVSAWPEIFSSKGIFICKIALLLAILIIVIIALVNITAGKKHKQRKNNVYKYFNIK